MSILIDGGLDATSLSQELDSRLPSWQRFLDVLLLTSPRADHLAGLQDIVTRYQVGEIIDAGMLHPSTAYALWRRTISERNLHYVLAVQGTTITVGTQVALQIFWPTSQLHKGSDEVRDNSLIVRLIAPGVRMLLLGATAQSKYALAGLLATIPPNSMQATIVEVVGEVEKQFPNELTEVLQHAHPSFVVVTPSSLSAKLRKSKATSVLTLPTALSPGASDVSHWQVMQTAQTGTLEFHSGNGGLIVNMT